MSVDTETQLTIEEALKTNDIVKYLSTQGIEPDMAFDGRWKYCCPLPSHQDDTPSFIVYAADSESPYQSYHCFGCKAHGTLIHLKQAIEKKTFREVLGEMTVGLRISSDDVLNRVVSELKTKPIDTSKEAFSELCWSISRMVNVFLRQVKFQEPYLSRCEKATKIFDDAISRFDIDEAYLVYEELGKLLDKQVDQYAEGMNSEILDVMQSYPKRVYG